MNPPPLLELFRKFIRFGDAILPKEFNAKEVELQEMKKKARRMKMKIQYLEKICSEK